VFSAENLASEPSSISEQVQIAARAKRNKTSKARIGVIKVLNIRIMQ
jgi:hypothetical protein